MKAIQKPRRSRSQSPLIYLVDRPEMLEFYTEVLRAAGYNRLRAFLDAEDALGSIKSKQERPKLLITAYLLNSELKDSMNGLTLIQQSSRVYPKLVFLLTSALPKHRIQPLWDQARTKPHAFLEKTDGMPHLVSTVATLLKRNSRRRPSPKKSRRRKRR